MTTIAELIRAFADDDCVGLRFEDDSWTYREYVAACEVRAHLLLELKPAGPFHVGVLMDNLPEYPFLIGGAALEAASFLAIVEAAL